MRTTNSLGNRLVALALSIIMVLGMVPTSVFAIEPTPAYGIVESFTDGVVINSSGSEVKATYGGTLNWIAKDESVGRMSDGWWVGLKVTAPETINIETAKYTSGGEAKLFKDYNDSADDAEVQWIGLWSLVKEDYLRSAGQTDGLSTYTWTFDWDGDGVFEQTVVLDIEAARTVLLNSEGQQVYPAAPIGNGTVVGITDGASISANGNSTTVTYGNITLNWDAADPAVGRNQDGWWVGMKITAPSELTKETDFTNVTYQSYGADGWSAAKSFWNAQDSDKAVADTARYLTMWGLITPELIANDNDNVLTYQYRFDWNGDGIYEQTLTMKVDATTVKLMKNGIQQLPLQYGAAEPITQGSVTGSETANSVITFENITLNWNEANPAVGRNQDGWWVGAKITAPTSMTTEAVCGNIKYQRYENGTWSEAKSFWNAQDSDKNAADTARYLTMWCLVTPELIANDNDGILTLQYRFDWNQDGEYEQQLTMKVDASKVTLLNENNVQVYPTLGVVTPLTNGTVTGSGTGEASVLIKDVTLSWSEAKPEIGRGQDGWWAGIKVTAPSGTDLENIKYRRKTAEGWTEAMAYAPDDGTNDTMQLWGLVTAEYLDQFIGYGRNMNYTWQFDWNNDGNFEQTVTMSVDPSNITLKQAGFDFSVDSDTITYGDNNNVYTILTPTGGQAGTLEYSISDPTVATLNSDGTLTILKAGTVEITATLSGEHYEDITATYTLTVNKADQPDFGFDNPPATVTWQEELWGALALKNGLGKGALTWSVKGDSDVASVDPATGKITLLKAGTFTLQVQKAGDDCYNTSAMVETEIEVLRKNQENFGFGETETVDVTYNDNNNQYTLVATGGQSSKDVVYTFSGDAVEVNETTGVVTILKSGVVTIKATKPADDRYNTITDSYKLTIEKDEQDFTFVHDKAIEEKYGLTSFETKITPSALNSGVITYAVSNNTIGATVNSSGLVSFANSTGKAGTVTVTVTMVEDDCYKACSKSYTITLDYESTPSTPYALYGDKIISGSSWFTGDVKIYAPNDYQISYSNDLTDNEWENYVEWKIDGETGTWAAGSEPVVYLKNSKTGAITDAIPVSDLKRDTVKPNGLAISYDVSVWATIGEKLFGFNASTVKVTVTAADSLSGIGKMEYSLDEGNTYTEIAASNGNYEFSVPSQYRRQLWMRATDVAGNAEVYKHLKDDKDAVLIVDHTEPGLTVLYSGGMDDEATNGIRYVKSKDGVKVVFEITDENFDLREVDPTVVVIRNNEATPVVLMNGDAEATWIFDATSGKLTFDLVEEGDYIIKAEFADRLYDENNPDSSNRKVTYESEVRIDRKKPVIESTIENGKYYTENQNFVLTITEHNFDADKVNLAISAVDSKGAAVLSAAEIQAFADLAKNPDKWIPVAGTDKHQLTLDIAKDGNYTVTVNFTDVLDWVADEYATEFTLDKVAPTAPVITYKTVKDEIILGKLFGFSKETVRVSIQTSDVTSGVDFIKLSLYPAGPSDATTLTMPINLEIYADGTVRTGEKGFIGNIDVVGNSDNLTLSFDVPVQFRGTIYADAYDKAMWNKETFEEKEIVVDDIAPDVVIEFTGDRQDSVKADIGNTITRETMSTPDATTRFIYNGNVTATIKIKEANFFKEIDMPITVIRDGQTVTTGFTDSGWSNEPDAAGYYVRTIVLQDDGDYRIKASYKDHSLNDMEWGSNEGSNEYAQSGVYNYESNIHSIDTKAPVYEVTYDNNEVIQTLNGRAYFKANREATIKVTDRNFRPNEVVFNVTATDIAGNAVTYTYSDLKSWSDWTKGTDGITWTATVPFAPDANYTVSFSYDDLANHKMVNKDNVEEVYNAEFTVDTKIPTGLKVEYKSKDAQVLNKILNAITFGNYKAAQEVVLTMTDATAGIDYIELTVTPEGPASATNLVMPENLVVNADGSVKSGTKGFIGTIRSSANNGDLTLSFDVPAQFRGKISFVAYDKSSNHSDSHADPGVLVVDTIAPGHTISYNPSNVVNVSDMKDMTGFDAANGITDITSTDSSYVMYFSGDAVATIKIDEANFDPSVVKIEVLDGNGDAVQGWTQTDWTTVTEAGKADSHTKTVTIPAEGDYQLKVYYQDHSMNTPVDYLSQWIVVDKTAPVIDVKYSNTDVKNTIENRDYFSATQTATITIKEHNFRADDVVIKVTAKDVLNADVLTLNADGTVKAYADQGADRKSWTSYEAGTWRVKDDAFIITLNYTTDANYTFDIEYQDLAKNVAADYEQDLFTVDVTAPKNLTVDYSTSVFEQIKESITFGYYNAMMTVTITAEDDTSGIYHFAYSYIKGKDVSGVNAELLDQAIKEAEITYDGKKATATFNIPKMVLGADNQFNGTVEFTAFDRSEITTELKDSTVIVVDNITPTSKITYNAPVQTANGISYYDGNINATIVINEANFDAKDVVVTVTKDGENFPVNVSWKDDSVDTHTGTFTLTKDGDYIVSVQYKDKSGNQMTSYKSNELTLDATKPTIKVSNIKANSANKDEKYGFVITVNDTNLDASSLKPVLKAVVQKEEGVYVTMDIDLGDAKTVVNGQTYTYTIEDLPDDGFYTLTCEVKDMSANGMSQIVLDDGESYDQVQFSVNRNGSAFGYGNKFTEELVGQYYIYSVDEDVVIVEVNVDPIEEYKVSLNGKELTEGTDYTTTQTSKDGEWSKRTYTIKKSLFEAEGEYSIIVTSTDKTATTAFSDVKNLSLAFVVDQTKPVLTITGLEAGGRYQTNAQTVTLIPTDEGGRLNSLTVLVLDSNGNPLKDDSGADISVRFEMSGEELLKYLEENDGKVTFTVPEGLNNQVKIVCNDCAVNAEDLTNEYNELFERVTVSQNQLVIFYANTPLFVGTIVGVLAVAGLIVFLIKRKKDKKNKTAAKA